MPRLELERVATQQVNCPLRSFSQLRLVSQRLPGSMKSSARRISAQPTAGSSTVWRLVLALSSSPHDAACPHTLFIGASTYHPPSSCDSVRAICCIFHDPSPDWRTLTWSRNVCRRPSRHIHRSSCPYLLCTQARKASACALLRSSRPAHGVASPLPCPWLPFRAATSVRPADCRSQNFWQCPISYPLSPYQPS